MLLRIAFLVSALLAVTPAPAAPSGSQTTPAGCNAVGSKVEMATPVPAPKAAFPPTQLQVRTPVAPVLLPSGDRNYLIYELHLLSLAQDPFLLRAIDIIDAASAKAQPLARFSEADFGLIFRHLGFDEVTDLRRLGPGQTIVAFLCLSFDRNTPVPDKLRHRVALGDSYADGPVVAVRRGPLPVLGRPVTGTGWHPRNGPHAGSHHRMGLFVADGTATISRRYAIDWRKSREGALSSGDPRNVRSYFTYGETVLAVADGTVLFALDGMPDNIPKTEAGFELAVPLTIDTIAGNAIVIDLGGGQLASYSHLQPSSLRVKTGDRVRRGQPIAKIGNSGDSRWPHLHFQVSTAINALAGEGEPFVIDKYRINAEGKQWESRAHDFPWGDTAVVDFGP